MSIMRWKVYNELKQTLDVPVRLTYGYLTKYTRIGNGLEKSHAVDARCISGNAAVAPAGQLFHFKQLRRHNRKVMKSNLLKGGRWKRNQAPREIKGFRLFDIVLHNNMSAYIHGRRRSGYFVVKDFEGNTLSNSASYKSLKLIRHNNNQMFIDKISEK
jgi:N6-L-threonylcarbamoyladenine synthase